ncbi:MAG TPA: NADPH-dependent 7-cyano-7-deazaguanine reductase QueF [Spirochaetota bacterium]|nr:NADPH-dependent 7-cyano-7-deazaguanine reductase QueF [Spirochaetota bacterium]HNT09981.1 NADPH-dependent 7-cyano-7-deazaguanine reductase QueF [Spirochaetota bacterium]HNV45686.1 NADPH-dependent 7-cyano-7-deazaguanine reductase QueF [Spirochaetota bacterium]HOS38240.1 NADPH-dependent 7-cyano-7-deazaguanine reductase QueF [Spirochaetota bacterium]HPI21812.1 NADPH-dependent 7-cyano-7-deazaguanine reductase QueF [Spirochaetota bacterium]
MTDYSKASTAELQTPRYAFDTIEAKGHRPIVRWEFPEFQSLCPVSERQDQGTVVVTYRPQEKILESKSVRDYFFAWRNLKNWQEYVTEEIADALFAACEPEWLVVEITWAPRGGIFATTVARRGDRSSIETV